MSIVGSAGSGLGGAGDIGGALGSFYSHSIGQSLRFEDGDSPYLNRNLGADGNKTTWTFSTWVKRGNLGSHILLASGNITSTIFYTRIGFTGTHRLGFYIYNDTNGGWLFTDRLFRDTSSWYHIVCVFDTSNSTSTDRMRIYVNGVRETSFVTVTFGVTYPSLNGVSAINESSYNHRIGRTENGQSGANHLDGYLADTHFVDGLALTGDSFGETQDSIWIPKKYEGSYGTQGWHLDYADSSDIGNNANTTDGTNDWTPSGLAATDVVLDSPTNGFPTANPLAKSSMVTLSEGNLKVAGNSASNSGNVTASPVVTSGKWYFEYLVAKNDGDTNFPQIAAYRSGLDEHRPFINGGTGTGGQVADFFSLALGLTNGDILGIAVDADGGTVSFLDNNSAISGKDIDISAYDSTGIWIGIGEYNTGFGYLNFGQDSSFAGNKTAQGNGAAHEDFFYTPPTGYKGLNLGNFDEPEIIDGSEYFNTVLYTGNGSTQNIDTGLAPDWVWIKSRSDGYDHVLYDTVRGATKRLKSSNTQKEATSSTAVTAFNSSSFSLGAGASSNLDDATFVSWNWLAGGSASLNENGTVDSQVSANTEAGFSIATFTGGAAGYTVGHGLTKAPEIIFTFNRTDDGGAHYLFTTAVDGTVDYFSLNATTAKNNDPFSMAVPTETVFSLDNDYGMDASDNCVAYSFHSVDSFSKVGSYVGNGNADGTYVALNFRPAWVMVKCTTHTGSWYIWDDKRSLHNEMDDRVVADLDAAEVADRDLDFLSNGFKLRESNNAHNTSGREYIYLAFASQPAKYSNAR